MADAVEQTSGAGEADLALTLFHEERYAEAAAHFERALQHDPDNEAWADLLAKASANATAEVSVFVPELRFFDADSLLAPPRSLGYRARATSPTIRTGAGSATSWGTPWATSAVGCSRRSRAWSVGTTAAACGPTGTASGSTAAS